ncbi:restriction endonuclease subunit S [Haliea sp. E1-2-M8]|uniref:restriction endonuclease subunit S n=1 Tax=Haliea sp. E1-2-M8 TaxID=3064706 RepID=UPI00272113FB|nr:restriction endonuclease subunit S [Haliea sp. E1-2-M8]MDO8861842.1 restriction endonuclease subunit S [Haliea sp. E1-2-M8]
MKLCPSSLYPHARLGDCGEIITGSTPSKSNAKFWGSEIPFVTPAQLGFEKPVTTAVEFVTNEGAARGRLLPEGAVLVCCIGSLGKTGVAGTPLISNQQINSIVFNTAKVDARYGYHTARNLTPLLELYAPSTTVKIVKKSAFANIEIPLPPLAEQKRIAGILDVADALRAKRRESIAQLDSLLQSTFVDMFGDPVTNPMGWEECTVGEVTDCIVPGRDKPKSFTGSTPWITTDDLVYLGYTTHSPKNIGLSPDEIKEVRARVIPEGSVIISCVGDLGVSSIAGCNIVVNQQLHAFQCEDRLNPEFLAFCLPFRKPWMRRRATKTTLPYLNKTNCNSIPIFVPPLELQGRFAAIVKSVEEQKVFYHAHLAELDTLFASLQSRAFSGEL